MGISVIQKLVDSFGATRFNAAGVNMLKQAILILSLMACVPVLWAQSGLYGLEFGESAAAARLKLESQDFSVNGGEVDPTVSGTLATAQQLIMVPEDDPFINGIELRFSPGVDSLNGWSIAYNFYEEEDMGELVIGALISRHGTAFANNAHGIYVWELGKDAQVIAGWDHFRKLFVVDYRQDGANNR